MSAYEQMTKADLLVIAKDRNISGRHDMTRDALEARLVEFDELVAAEKETISPDEVKQVKRKVASTRERDESGKVIRVGRNLSGNQPFKAKYYFLPVQFTRADMQPEGYDKALQAAPNQVRLILKAMRELKMTTAAAAERGSTIVQHAIDTGILSTKCDPAELFSYYRRLLETLGVKEANGSEEEGFEDEDEASDADDFDPTDHDTSMND